MQRQRSGRDNGGGRGQYAAMTEGCDEKTRRSFSQVVRGDLSPPQREEESESEREGERKGGAQTGKDEERHKGCRMWRQSRELTGPKSSFNVLLMTLLFVHFFIFLNVCHVNIFSPVCPCVHPSIGLTETMKRTN